MEVIQIPIADCASHSDCTSCLGNGNPLCGWCVVENKCSNKDQCHHPDTRWIQAAGVNLDHCPMTMVSPSPYVVDSSPALVSCSHSVSTTFTDIHILSAKSDIVQ